MTNFVHAGLLFVGGDLQFSAMYGLLYDATIDSSSATVDLVVLIVIPELQYMYVNAMFHNVQGT